MHAVVLSGGKMHFKRDAPAPPKRNDEVLVRVLRAGICETDLQLIRGYMGFDGILGHEFVGIAEEGSLAGRRVAGEINCACRVCATCKAGMTTHCPHRSVLGILDHDGAFAERIAVPEANLHALPESLSDDAAVFVEPVAAALEILEQVSVMPETRVVVLGDGRLGNLCAQVLAGTGAAVTVVGKHTEKLRVLENLGIATALLDETQPGRDADVVVDCTGSESGLPIAIEFVRPRGTIVLKTTVAGEQTVALARLVIDEITLVGSRCGPFEKAVAALAEKKVVVEPLISARYPLEQAEEAFREAQRAGVLKVLFEVGA